jgi:ribose/xylose/arabinose/galactoside ABC-type transport system permease subunit
MSARFPFYLLADSVDGMAKEAALSGKPSPAGPVTNDIPRARSSPSGDSNPLSSHFAAMLWARGLGLQLASAKCAVVAPDNGLLSFGRQTWLGLTAWTWLMLLAFAVGAFALKYSAWARRVLAIGGNEESAQLLGVQTTGTKVSVYVLSGLAAGLAGIGLASQTGLGQHRYR